MKLSLLIVLFFGFTLSSQSQFLEKKEGLKNYEGFFNFFYSEKDDEIYLEVNDLDKE